MPVDWREDVETEKVRHVVIFRLADLAEAAVEARPSLQRDVELALDAYRDAVARAVLTAVDCSAWVEWGCEEVEGTATNSNFPTKFKRCADDERTIIPCRSCAMLAELDEDGQRDVVEEVLAR